MSERIMKNQKEFNIIKNCKYEGTNLKSYDWR